MRHKKYRWHFWYKLGGDHVHMRIFSGPDESASLAKCGDVVMRADEFDRFRSVLTQASTEFDYFQFNDAAERSSQPCESTSTQKS